MRLSVEDTKLSTNKQHTLSLKDLDAFALIVPSGACRKRNVRGKKVFTKNGKKVLTKNGGNERGKRTLMRLP